MVWVVIWWIVFDWGKGDKGEDRRVSEWKVTVVGGDGGEFGVVVE